MSADAEIVSFEPSKAYRPILLGGLTAGILDITAAFVNSGLRGRSPLWVLQSVASGLLGADSYKGGLRAAALGAFFHFLIAFTATTVYYLASRKLSFMVKHAILSGLLYGVAVYLFMYFILLRIVFPTITYTFTGVFTAVVIHMLFVGLPISLAVRRYSNA